MKVKTLKLHWFETIGEDVRGENKRNRLALKRRGNGHGSKSKKTVAVGICGEDDSEKTMEKKQEKI